MGYVIRFKHFHVNVNLHITTFHFFLTAYRPDTEAILKQLVLMINGKSVSLMMIQDRGCIWQLWWSNNFTNHLVQLA